MLALGVPGAGSAGWKLRQLTDCVGGFSENPVISVDGRTVVFISSCDLVSGGNADHNRELFRWREEEDGLEQMTRSERCQNLEPTMDAAGGKIAFATTCAFGPANPDQNLEIALWEGEGPAEVLTESPSHTSTRPVLAPSGRWLAFLSNADFLGQNPEHNQQVFLIHLGLPHRPLSQASRAEQAVCREPALSNTVVAAACNFRLGDENPEGNFELLTGSPEGTLHFVTRTRDCENREPQLNALGNLVLFRSNCNLRGQNLNRYSELFLSRGAGEIEQVTHAVAEGAFQPALSADGRRAAFVSRWGREFQNPDHNSEVFVLELRPLGRPTPVAETSQGGCYSPRLSGDGRRLVFYGNVNPLGANPDGSFEIFLAEETISGEKNSEDSEEKGGGAWMRLRR